MSSVVANDASGETLLAMVTTASAGARPGDTPIVGLADAGLRTPCVVRLKLFTLDNRLIARRIGGLSSVDRTAVRHAVSGLIAL